ncbi:methionine synthase [Nocardioides sp. YIM 152315]|uniref:methionine synthase n=1 Tax=Nocardioides sp. YIM 152315 TaxID=3031760 RepID=UPI0023DC97DE|nr:methionine synthase [Nocardioides sp. YIM 152315]MDF1605206.1 methionine synthase [Nocardioides sp. YIM 152315]
MVTATGVGSMPGDDQQAYDEALRVVLGELPDLPHLPEVPGRGATATMTGRALAIVAELGADLQPAGWRLTGGGGGVDQRRARSLLAQDLDGLEEQAQGFAGVFKVQVAGPWTLAATVERPRGDKVLADVGARRELAQALAEGLRGHVADVRRRLSDVERLVVQVDEPALAAVLDGRVPTASGFHKHRSVDLPEASAAVEWVLAAIADAGAEPWVHSCAADVPWPVLRKAGALGLSVDLATLTAADHDALAEALEAGESVALGAVPTLDPATPTTDAQLTESVLRWLDMLGLDPAGVGDRLVVTPACGLAGASPAWARRALGLARAAATHVSG